MSKDVLSSMPEDLLQQITQFESLLPSVWSRESSGDPVGWTPHMPSYMQCHATTRLAKKLFGGLIIYQTLKPALVLPGEQRVWGHCINEIHGFRFDFTAAQLKCLAFSVSKEQIWRDRERDFFDQEWPGMRMKIDTLFASYEQATSVRLAVR